jgi:hypothetical protein
MLQQGLHITLVNDASQFVGCTLALHTCAYQCCLTQPHALMSVRIASTTTACSHTGASAAVSAARFCANVTSTLLVHTL